MKKLVTKVSVFLSAAVLMLSNILPVTAKAAPDPSNVPDIKAEAVMLIDANTGKILYEKNADEPLHPASMSKMMTEYLVLDAIKAGKIKWDQKVSISDYAFKISHDKTLSNVYLRQDDQYTVRELYESMAIYSANGSTIALAELLAGSETSFIKMMNDKAASFGMKNYKFVNCTGLNNEDLKGMQPEGTGPDEENTMSARDTAILAFRLLHDHPEVLQTSSIASKGFREGTPDYNNMQNWNWMLPGSMYPVLDYQGVDGLKTGSTNLGKFSFTGTVKRGNLRFLSVVMKCSDKIARFTETKKLYNYAFSNYSEKEIAPAGYKPQDQAQIPVVKGKAKKVDIVTQNPLMTVVKNGEENMYAPGFILDNSLAKKGALVAPLTKGQAVGTLTANYKGSTQYTYLPTAGAGPDKVQVVTAVDVKKANWLVLFFRGIGDFFSSLFKK